MMDDRLQLECPRVVLVGPYDVEDGRPGQYIAPPLGISCIASLATGDEEPTAWFSRDEADQPAKQMSQADVAAFVKHLFDATQNGFAVLTWNGLSFDFDILAEESGMSMECKQLAREHVDMMFQIFCERGFGVGLNAAARALGLSKPEDVDGSVAPNLWRDGQHDVVLDYVACDCKLTMEVAKMSEETRSFVWITKREKRSKHDLPTGWMTAEQALKLPLPDTSWMDNPWPRSKFTAWLEAS